MFEIFIYTRLTGTDDAFNEIITRYQLVVVLINLPKEICESRLFVIHEFQESLPPVIPHEVVRLLFLLQIRQVIVEFALSLPRQHPNVTPLVV